MDINHDTISVKTYIEPIKWCRYIVKVGYATVTLIILAHVIWFFAARSVLAWPVDIYLRNYIILPAIWLLAVTFLIDLFVRSPHFSLVTKEYLSLSLFIIFSAYLSFTHEIAKVLLGSFLLPIFVSTVFSNVKVTRFLFWMSNFSVLLLGMNLYCTGDLTSDMIMQIFVACFMFLCAYLLSKVLIRYGHDNLTALTQFDQRQQYMCEQLKLDPFTELYNRKTFDDWLPKQMEECRSTNQALTLAMMDIDHFKSVNDLYGHAAGDRVLLYLSQILKSIQTESIYAFRTGGDELAVIFSSCDVTEAYRICEHIRTQMETCPIRDNDKERITLSCGLASMNEEINPKRFTKAADSALYEAKNNGRNQVVIYKHTQTT